MIRLAWRNVWRNFRRSLITIASMACGLAALMFGQSMIKSVQYQLIEKATGSITGHIQIQHRMIKEYKFPDRYIDDPDPVEEVLKRQPGIKAFGRRIHMTGLISSPKTSMGALISAVQPDREKNITAMSTYIVKGTFLGKDPKAIVMGDRMVTKLDLRLGEKVVVMAQAEDGSMGAEAFRLSGVFHTGSETFDGQIVYLPVKAMQELLVVGNKVNHFVIALNNIEDTDAVAQQLKEKLAGKPLQVLRWKDVDHEIVGVQRFQNALLDIVLTVVFAIVALGVLNTLLMSLFERVREFGVLMAIGARPSWVMKLVLIESLLLGAVGTVFGLIAGSLLIGYYGHHGLRLPLGEALSYFIPFPDVIYMRYVWEKHLFAAGAVLVTSFLAAITPSLRACRLRPAEALRHV
ncbi:MAG: ABC transporter permease [Elusimicrobia bacterium]|nr:ABC transporter permease [Elusimicrobiota bacterium]